MLTQTRNPWWINKYHLIKHQDRPQSQWARRPQLWGYKDVPASAEKEAQHECQKVEKKNAADISLFLTTPENQDNFLEMMILHDLDPYINLPQAETVHVWCFLLH